MKCELAWCRAVGVGWPRVTWKAYMLPQTQVGDWILPGTY